MATKKTNFRKATLELALALNVEPAEALSIARTFDQHQAGLTEAETCSQLMALLKETVPSRYSNDRDYDMGRVLRAVESTGESSALFIKVAKRFRSVRLARHDWEEAISDALCHAQELADVPDRFCKREDDAASIRFHAAKLAKLLGAVTSRPHYCNPPTETLGF